jgi:hypothetical protein
MSTAPPLTLEDAIRKSGQGWLIDSFTPRDQALAHLRKTLEAINHHARQRLGPAAPDLSEDAVVHEFQRRPQQVRAFFQALGGTRTPDMLLMVWRIIQGMEIEKIDLSYRRAQSFEVSVTLESPYGEPKESYQSTNIHDFTVFRHIGAHEVDRKPVFDGFYALKLP